MLQYHTPREVFSERLSQLERKKLFHYYRKVNIDTTLIFHINSAYAEFEREIIRSGIKVKREKTGTWGRQEISTTIQEKIRELSQNGLSIRKISKTLQISARTVQKYLKTEVNAIV